MKVTVISYFMPYWENFKGISALIYYIIKYKPQDVELTLYTFNCNHLSEEQIHKVEKELDVPIRLIPEPESHYSSTPDFFNKYIGWMFRHEKNMLSLPETIKTEIRQSSPDYIWLYPFYFYHIPEQMPEMKFVLTGCDSNALLKKRCLNDKYYHSNWLKLLKANILYRRCLSTERNFPSRNCLIHFVGKEDCDFYNSHTGHNNGVYVPHPHYAYREKRISFHSPKLQLLIAGKYDFYMKTESDRLFAEIKKSANLLRDKVNITFLGKGWDSFYKSLATVGYEVYYKEWVDNYLEEIIKYDIQVVPLSLGTGTKGKVLDAMSNGLLVIGTRYALENISDAGEGCVIYNEPHEVVQVLQDVFSSRLEYEGIAERGREIVLKEHDPTLCSKAFFEIFK